MIPAWTFWNTCYSGRKKFRKRAAKRSEYDQYGFIIRNHAFYSGKVFMVVRLLSIISEKILFPAQKNRAGTFAPAQSKNILFGLYRNY